MMVMQFSKGGVLAVFLFVLIWPLLAGRGVAGAKFFKEQHVKTIKSPDGDTIECVHISQQPAFDDPLLKDHIIQLTPTNHPKGLFDERKNLTTSPSLAQFWHQNGRCPEGTIPIQRNIKNFGKKYRRSNSIPDSTSNARFQNHEHAFGYVATDEYYGTKVTMNVWKPFVEQPHEFSLGQLWILGFRSSASDDLNSIEVGWQVAPSFYGDNNPRLFIYWTRDGYHATGCYNIVRCPGFVQTNNAIAFGATIPPVSTYDSSQYEITVLVWKDEKSGNWWLQINDDVMGYWPPSIFTYLQGSASQIQWGGEIINLRTNGQHTTTQMGSGHFAQEGFRKASYFRNIETVDASNSLNVPQHIYDTSEQPNCYNAQTGYDANSEWGQYLFYGGPGRNANCP